MSQIDLKKITGVVVEQIAKTATVDTRIIDVAYRSGYCFLGAHITYDRFATACRVALDLIDAGFEVSEITSTVVRASKYVSAEEFAHIYNQSQEIEKARYGK